MEGSAPTHYKVGGGGGGAAAAATANGAYTSCRMLHGKKINRCFKTPNKICNCTAMTALSDMKFHARIQMVTKVNLRSKFDSNRPSSSMRGLC